MIGDKAKDATRSLTGACRVMYNTKKILGCVLDEQWNYRLILRRDDLACFKGIILMVVLRDYRGTRQKQQDQLELYTERDTGNLRRGRLEYRFSFKTMVVSLRVYTVVYHQIVPFQIRGSQARTICLLENIFGSHNYGKK